MKINWQPNPLYSTIELDTADKTILRLNIHVHELEEVLADAAINIEEDRLNIEKVRNILDWDQWSDDPGSPLKERINRLYALAIDELESGVHAGDCTCVPMSCMKCHAESMIGVSTIEGLGKHEAYKIDAAFSKSNDGSVSLDEAIERLTDYKPKADWLGWEAHAVRWKAEAEKAKEWLIKYRDEHFP